MTLGNSFIYLVARCLCTARTVYTRQ